jgi:hypothetical protein
MLSAFFDEVSLNHFSSFLNAVFFMLRSGLLQLCGARLQLSMLALF